jgi:hypothetical protein
MIRDYLCGIPTHSIFQRLPIIKVSDIQSYRDAHLYIKLINIIAFFFLIFISDIKLITQNNSRVSLDATGLL